MKTRAVACLLTISLFAGADTPKSAIKKVQEGIQHFQNSKWDQADSAFSEAEKLAPENSTVIFDRACARRAKGDIENARSDFRTATLSKSPGIAVRSHYNLGCLEAEEAKKVLGGSPEEVEGDTRERSIQLLLTSVRHYRSALRVDRDHKPSRHNLELIRLYIKHIQSKWEERDRQKKRDEQNLIQFLNFLEERQDQLLTATTELDEIPAGAASRRFTRDTADAQDLLQEEIEPLREKIRSKTAGPNAGQQPDQNEAAAVLDAEAVRVGDFMQQAVIQLQNPDVSAAATEQRQALAGLNNIYLAVASYQQVLRRAIQTQQAWAPTTPSNERPDDSENQPVDTSTEDQRENSTSADDGEETEFPEAIDPVQEAAAPPMEKRWQPRVSSWISVLPLHAEQQLPQLRQQLDEIPDADEQVDTDEDKQAAAPQELSEQEKQKQQLAAQKNQLQGLIASMELAQQLGPQALADSQAANSLLEQDQGSEADVRQAAVLKTLKKIAEPLAEDEQNEPQDDDQQDQDKDDPQDQNQDENQNKDDNRQDENGDDKDRENQEGGEDESKQDDPQKDEEEGKQDDQQQKDQKQQSQSESGQQTSEERQRRVESTIRKAREREEEHRRRMKQIRALLNRANKVERDW